MMTQADVATVLGISVYEVRVAEESALRKLRRDPVLRNVAELMGIDPEKEVKDETVVSRPRVFSRLYGDVLSLNRSPMALSPDGRSGNRGNTPCKVNQV